MNASAGQRWSIFGVGTLASSAWIVPTMVFEAFLKVVDVPIDYKNPVTGR